MSAISPLDNVHPYDNNREIYNFFFHPFHFKIKKIVALSIISNIFITAITLGVYQIFFWTINRLENRKLEVWRRDQSIKINTVATRLRPNNQQSSQSNNVSVQNPPEVNTPSEDAQPQTNPVPVPLDSIKKSNVISEELMNSLLEEMEEYGSTICVFLRQVYYSSPRDLLELYIHHVLNKFNVNNDIVKKKSKNHVEFNVKHCEVDPSNELDLLVMTCRAFDLTDEGLYKNYLNRATGFPLTSLSTNMLLSYYLGKNEDVVFLDFSGQSCLEEKDPTNKVVVSGGTPMGILDSESEVIEFIQTLLENELCSHLNNRPRTLLIPFAVKKPGTDAHQVLLAVEPSHTDLRQARITMINTHGNSLNMYKSYEIAAINAAKMVYNDPGTIAIRNEKKLWATPSCTHNILDILCQLVDVPNIQDAVKKGLAPTNAKMDVQARLEHGEKINVFLEEKLTKARQSALGIPSSL